MKKTYLTPLIKDIRISSRRILCTSEVNFGSRYYGSDYDYIGGSSESGYGYGIPD